MPLCPQLISPFHLATCASPPISPSSQSMLRPHLALSMIPPSLPSVLLPLRVHCPRPLPSILPGRRRPAVAAPSRGLPKPTSTWVVTSPRRHRRAMGRRRRPSCTTSSSISCRRCALPVSSDAPSRATWTPSCAPHSASSWQRSSPCSRGRPTSSPSPICMRCSQRARCGPLSARRSSTSTRRARACWQPQSSTSSSWQPRCRRSRPPAASSPSNCSSSPPPPSSPITSTHRWPEGSLLSRPVPAGSSAAAPSTQCARALCSSVRSSPSPVTV